MNDCTAARHRVSTYSYKHGCRCPDVVAYTRALWKARRLRAKARGYVKPSRASYVDPIAVERVVRGDRVRLNHKERALAAETLTRAGHAAREIARRLQVTRRQVQRYRAKERAA